MDFPRNRTHIRHLPLTPLIDVSFILIIFFMLTTSFMKIESLEMKLPVSGAPKKIAREAPPTQIFLKNNGETMFGIKTLAQGELSPMLDALFIRSPEQKVVVMTAERVSLQRLVEAMDAIYRAGGKSVFVKAWNEPPPPIASAPSLNTLAPAAGDAL